MKTLQEEVVEALFGAAPLVCELSWEHYLQLAVKVESARCDNCEQEANNAE